MVRAIAVTLVTLWCLLPFSAHANDAAKQLIGSWRLKSLVLEIVGEETTQPFGSDPKGSIVITENGRFIAVISSSHRKPATNNDERAALLGSLIAYTGKYTVDGDRITTKVDTSWNELYSGANENQVRIFKLEGDTLTLKTPEQASAVRPGKRVVATLIWERER